MEHTKRRLLGTVLALSMVLSLLPATAVAAGSTSFTDVKDGDWYHDAVEYVSANDLMNGTGDGAFSPEVTTSRGMLVTTLHRMEGTPAPAKACPFDDVAPGSYYERAVAWAASNGIVNGCGEDKFSPDAPITREQLAAVLYRYLQFKELPVDGRTELNGFSDRGRVSDYAVEAMQWAVAVGLISGMGDGTLAPQGEATRAQMAMILYRLRDKVIPAAEAARPETETFTVTFQLNYTGAGVYKTVEVPAGEAVTAPDAPSRSGYSFGGWYAKATGGSRYSFSTPVTGDLTLYAHWTSRGSGGSSSGHSHSYTATVTTEPTCTEEGVRTYTCSCGATYTEAIPALGHDYGEWTKNGDKTHSHVCTRCSDVVTEDCTFGAPVEKAVTTSEGNTETTVTTLTYTCEDCGFFYTEVKEDTTTFAALVGDTLYTTLDAAVTAAQTGSDKNITLVSDVALSAQIVLPEGVTLDGGGYTISTADGSTWTGNDGKHLLGINNKDVKIQNVTLDSRSSAYGVQAYRATGVELTNVTILNSVGAGLTVNGSIVTASGLKISGSSWGCVNVDKGTGVSSTPKFTLTSGELSDATQIWSELKDTSVVEANGYHVYQVAEAPQDHYIWSTRDIGDILNQENVTKLTLRSGQTVSGDLTVPTGKTLVVPSGVELTVTGDVSGSITDENENELIYSATQLKALATAVNGGNNYSGKTVKLMANIDLNNENWTPIGLAPDNENGRFAGTFDGQNHTISNLKIDFSTNTSAEGDKPAGLFGAVSGEIKDFTIDGASVKNLVLADPTTKGTAVAAGTCYPAGKVTNVTVKNASVDGNRYVGGIAGYVYGTISNCSVEDTVLKAVPNAAGDTYDNGDKVGGIVGFLGGDSGIVSDNSVKGVTLTAYRDVGGITGILFNGSVSAFKNNTVTGAEITIDQQTNAYGAKAPNAGAVVGRYEGTSETALDGTNIFSNVTISYKLSGEITSGLTLSSDTTIDGGEAGVTIAPTDEGASAITIDGDVTLTILGSVTLKGARNGDGIEVPEDAKLTLTGSGTLIAVGNARKEHADDYYKAGEGADDSDPDQNSAGSGIGNADSNEKTGTIVIEDLAHLTAEGYGTHAFGIGGNTDAVTISDTTIDYVRGGFAKSLPHCNNEDSTKYAKDGEGGVAIGTSTANGVVTLTGVTVTKAEGGAKCAAIGGFYHVGVTVNITDCTLTDITGGHSAAAIGGGRATNDADDKVTIKIVDSSIQAQGGYYGAGIGSGYDTDCSGLPSVDIEITGSSKIAAVGGKYAAGIGTGYHVGKLTGSIGAGVDTTGTKANETAFYKEAYTTAQDIGYSVVDPNREFKGVTPTFTVGGTTITTPVPTATPSNR